MSKVVYLVSISSYDEYAGETVMGIFSTKELAREYIDTIPQEEIMYFGVAEIREYDLDSGEPWEDFYE